MGTVVKNAVTKALPAHGEIYVRKGQRFARWKDKKGRKRTAPLTRGENGQDRIAIESGKYIAKYRDGSGIVREVATGCREEAAARRVLADLERKAELVKANVMTSTEAAAAQHQSKPISEHFDAYIAFLEAKGACKEHRIERLRQLNRIAKDCSFHRLADLDRSKLESWLTLQVRNGMSARTRNSYLA